jgi:cell division protein FtsN
MGGGPGRGQWLALGGAVLVILALTFALGLLVGRQWARQTVTAVSPPSISEAARKAAVPARRSGIAAEVMADRPPEPTEKLTFYQTLTEPLNGPGVAPRAEAKPVAVKAPATAPVPAAPAQVSLPPAPSAAAPQTPWTIQVGAYKSRRQADETRQHLAAAGLDAYVATLAAQEGQARFRVRVGTYRTREEAAAAAERLRAQRSLTTFVTPK